jgi:hypothetical protein
MVHSPIVFSRAREHIKAAKPIERGNRCSGGEPKWLSWAARFTWVSPPATSARRLCSMCVRVNCVVLRRQNRAHSVHLTPHRSRQRFRIIFCRPPQLHSAILQGCAWAVKRWPTDWYELTKAPRRLWLTPGGGWAWLRVVELSHEAIIWYRGLFNAGFVHCAALAAFQW